MRYAVQDVIQASAGCQAWDYLVYSFLYEGAVHPRNMAQGFWYQDLSGPAEHLGALLKTSPSTFLLQSGGAQSAWAFKLLVLEQQAWETWMAHSS